MSVPEVSVSYQSQCQALRYSLTALIITGQVKPSIPTAPTAPFENDDASKAEEKAIELVQMLVVGPKRWLESIRRPSGGEVP